MATKDKNAPRKDNRHDRQSRSSSQIERDNVLISTLYLKGYSQWEIADKTNLNQSTVSRALKSLQSKWQEKSVMNIDERKKTELEKIDLIEREAWKAWEKSKGQKNERYTRSKGQADKADPTKMKMLPVADIHVKQWDADGDPKFLLIIMQCVERRCKILGIDAPVKMSKYELNAQTPKPILRRVAAGIPVDIAFAEYSSGVNKELYGE